MLEAHPPFPAHKDENRSGEMLAFEYSDGTMAGEPIRALTSIEKGGDL